MPGSRGIEDIIGIESVKLGFFEESRLKIAELKDSNAKLDQKRQEIQAILDGIPDVMAVISPDLTLLTVNQAFRKTYKLEDPQGLPCYRVLRGRDEPCSPCLMRQLMEEPSRLCRKLHAVTMDGEKRQLECTASMMLDAEGKPSKMLLLQRDVTQEKQYQDKYHQAEKMATVGMLAEGIAHEINNPLTSIGGFAETMVLGLGELSRRVPDDPTCTGLIGEFTENLQIILEECHRCSEIVRNLLTFGHREITSYAIVNLNDVIANSIKLLHLRLERLPPDIIRLRLDQEGAFVLGHAGELMQVVLNLVLNALYAVKDSGSVTIRTGGDANQVTLRVIDTGLGIPEEHLDKLFEPFFTTKPPGQGIGIGLSTCYNIIKMHGGDITVESTYGKGAVFTVSLPRLAE